MRRMLFVVAAAVSATVFVAACVLWARSYWGEPGPHVFDSRYRAVRGADGPASPGGVQTCYFSQRLVVSYRGYVGIGRINGHEDVPNARSGLALSDRGVASEVLWQQMRPPALGGTRDTSPLERWGFIAVRGADASDQPRRGAGLFYDVLSGWPPVTAVRYWWVSAPYWALAATAAILPTIWAWARLRRRRHRSANQCGSCGYDLTANLSGVCPECGTPAAAR